RDPALALLAGDVRQPGLAVGMEAVELPLQSLLGRFPGVDCAPELPGGSRAHGPPWRFTPKKVSPFHRVPVIARATALRLLYRRPCHSKPSASTVTLCLTPRHSRMSCVPTTGPLRMRFRAAFGSSASASASSLARVAGLSPPYASSWIR